MLLYSETISTFITRIKKMARQILIEEMQLNIRRSRIEFNGMLYPLNFVVFEDNQKLGYFDSQFYQVGLNKKLMYSAKNPVLKNILRHELAHFATHLKYGQEHKAHGNEFRDICRLYGWDKTVWNAYSDINLENEKVEGDLASEKIISKIKKLLALASSSNSHESELATLKANSLLLEHNLSMSQSQKDLDQQEIFVLRVLSGKRNSAKFKAIYEILQTFFVQPVFNHGQNIFYLEVLGERINVEMADYVANFLDLELDNLWNEIRKENPNLKGSAKKNSFMRGIAHGYVEKIRSIQRENIKAKSLVRLEKDLQTKIRQVYNRCGHSSSSSSKNCEQSASLGRDIGKNLNIRPGLKSQSNSKKLLTY
jgi:hypothetical protein